MKKLIFLVLIFTSTISKAQQMTAELFKETDHDDLIYGIFSHGNTFIYNYLFSSIPVNKSQFIKNYFAHDSSTGMIETFNIDTKVKKSIDIKSGLDSIYCHVYNLTQYHNNKYYSVYTKVDSASYFDAFFYNDKNVYLFETDTNLNNIKKTRIGTELKDSAKLNHKGFLVDDSFAYNAWFLWGDTTDHDRVILAKHDLNSGTLVDSVYLPPYVFFQGGQYIYKFDWVNDSIIIVYGSLTTLVHAPTMEVISQDTLHYADIYSHGIILADAMFNLEDTAMYYFSYNGDGTNLHRYSSDALLERYGNIDEHSEVPNWPAPGYYTIGGNHFRYLNYNYLAHIGSQFKRQLFMCFDEQGDLRWAKIYEGNGDSILAQSIHATPDSGMVDFIMYKNAAPNREDKDAYILKLDKDGNQEVDWLLSSGAPKRLALPDALILYPNPTQHSLHLANQNLHQTQGKISVYDAAGALVLQQEFSPEIEVSQLPPGTYIYSLEPEEGAVLSAPFVVE